MEKKLKKLRLSDLQLSQLKGGLAEDLGIQPRSKNLNKPAGCTCNSHGSDDKNLNFGTSCSCL